MKNLVVLLGLVLTILVFTPKSKEEVRANESEEQLSSSSETSKKQITNIKVPDRNSILNNHHYFSEEYVDFAREIGKLKKAIINHPENLTSGIEFLKDCTHDNDLTLAVRSLCLSNIYYFEKRFNINISHIPKNKRLEELARLVSDL